MIIVLEKLAELSGKLNTLLGFGYKMLIPAFALLLWRSFFPNSFSGIGQFAISHHWNIQLQTWMNLASILITLANHIGIVLVIPWFIWSLLLLIIPPWRERVEANWAKAGSYTLGWLILSSVWWWIYYAFATFIQPTSVQPVDAYSACLYAPSVFLVAIEFLQFFFVGDTSME